MAKPPSSAQIASGLVAAVSFMTAAGYVIMKATSPSPNDVLAEMQAGGRNLDQRAVRTAHARNKDLFENMLGQTRDQYNADNPPDSNTDPK